MTEKRRFERERAAAAVAWNTRAHRRGGGGGAAAGADPLDDAARLRRIAAAP